MHKLSYKTLLTVVVFLLIGIVVLLKLNSIKKVSAAWWNDSWNYRKAINVSNPGSSQTNSQIKILNNYDLSTLVTAGKIQSDLDDLRFTDINGTLLNYWIEDSTNNSADIWLILPTLPTSGATVYMYYGNSTATGISSTSNMTIGGTMTSVNGYRIHTFNNSDTLTNIFNTNAEVLVVAGGGGGASSTGGGGGGSGGGGAGGLIYNSSYSLTQNQTINVTVGIGGSTAVASTNQPGTNGGDSIFNTLTATGGGGGAKTGTNGVSGGSGGGAGYNGYTTVRYGGGGIVGIGNSGGNTSNLSYAGGAGGGGASGVGGDNKTGHAGGDGGLGISYSITGVGVTYSVGGRGGGGALPVSKTANTGYGGDGAYAANTPTSGASGIVVIRFLSGIATMSSSEEVGGGPIAYWKFDEGIGTTAHDSTLNNHNGTLFNGTSWADESQCISEKCLSFDGVNDYVGAGIGTDYFPMQTFSMCAWIKSPGLAAGMTQNGIMSLTYGLSMSINGSGQFWSYIDNGTNLIQITATSSSLYDNKFHHLCLTYDGTNRKMYIDGNLKNTTATAWTGTTRWPTNTVNIGHENNNSTIYKFNGLIDEPKIYRYALTDNQVKLNYNSRGSLKGSSVNLGIKSNTKPDISSNLIGYWKFDEGHDITAHDSSSQNNNATLKGTTLPTWTDGKYNKAVSFINVGTTSYVEANYKSAYNATNNFTLSTWVNPSSFASQPHLVGHYYQYGLYLNSSGAPSLILRRSDDVYAYLAASKNIPLNKWSHISTTFKDGVVRFYINGVFVSTQTIPTTTLLSIASNSVTIGIYFNKSGSPLAGSLDDVKIYNSALTDDEIKIDYNQGSSINFGATNQTIGNTTTSLEYCVPGDTSLCNSPIAQWNFEENIGTTAFDNSGNNNNGTFGAGDSAPTWTTGKTGSGLNFDGQNDYISSTSIAISPEMTWEVWYKSNTAKDEFLIDQRSSGTGVQPIYTYSTGQIQFFDSTNGSLTSSTGAIKFDNKWHHVAVTGTSSTRNIYVDGINVGTTNSGITPQTSTPIYVGSRYSLSSFFSGSMDQVRVYNYSRTPSQIAYDYNKGAPFAWWKFDECQGSVVNNSSGIGNSGSITVGASGYQNSLGTCQVGTSATWTNGASGKYNGSLNFDGTDDYVSAPFTPLGVGKPFTMSCWFKTSATFGYSPGIISFGYSPIVTMQSNGTLRAWWYNGVSYPAIVSTKAYNNGVFHNVAFSYDGTTASLYVDGVLQSSTASTVNSIYGNLEVGLEKNSGPKIFNGQIDDARFYNYGLTSTQIKTLYNNGSVSFN